MGISLYFEPIPFDVSPHKKGVEVEANQGACLKCAAHALPDIHKECRPLHAGKPIIVLSLPMNFSRRPRGKDMDTTSLIELCTALVGLISDHGMASCIILIRDP